MRKMTCLVGLTGLVGVLCLGPAPGEEADQERLSLRECIAIALEHQIDVLVGERTLESAKQRETGRKADYYPQLAVQDSRVVAKSGAMAGGRSEGTSLTVTQNFYDGGQREARIGGVRAEVAQASYALERTRRRDIQAQFLVEALVLSLVGGVLGIVLGAAGARILPGIAGMSVSVSPASIVLSFGFAALVGIFFGFYPARKASEQDPVEALRYE